MAESMSGDVWSQVLQAVQGLSEQVKGLSEQVKGLGDRMDRLEARMDRLETRMDKLETRMDRLETRMDTQEVWMQRLGLEFTDTRGEVKQLRQALRSELQTELRSEIQTVRTEVQLGIRQMNDRIDRNNDALHLMISGLHRNTAERFGPMEQRLHSLEVR